MSIYKPYEGLKRGTLVDVPYNQAGRFLHFDAENPERKWAGNITYYFLDGVETGYKCDGSIDVIAISREWGPLTSERIDLRTYDEIFNVKGRVI